MFTHTHRQTYLAQGGVLHSDLTKEKVDVVTVVDGVQEVRLCREKEKKEEYYYWFPPFSSPNFPHSFFCCEHLMGDKS